MILITSVALDLDDQDLARVPPRTIRLSKMESKLVLGFLAVAARESPSTADELEDEFDDAG